MKAHKVLFLFFAVTTFSFAQSLSGVKVCIDPGHGGHNTSNDRYIPIPNFWESEGNYSKSVHLKEILTSLGATVIVTRNGNSDSDDIGLSVRAGIANSNNVDLFHSIHSNGYHGDANYSLVLFRGTDSSPIYPNAKAYAKIVYDEFEKTNHVVDRSNNARGITSFYGSDYLGVIRPLTMPGILSEGSFHDYIPEGWRLKSEQYLRHEAWAIARSMLEYFGGGILTNGNVAGILRDPIATVPSSYKPISVLGDSKKPLNNVKATLQPGNFVYNGDDQNNGYYFFENITPGKYKLYLEAEDYAMDSASVTVYANRSTFVNKTLALIPNNNNPNVIASVPNNNKTDFSNVANIEVMFDIRMDKTSTMAAFSITPSVAGSLSWEDNEKRLVFNPTTSLTPGQTYQVTISSSAKTIFDKNLQSDYSFQFITRAKLKLVNAYPTNNAVDISRSVEVRLQFDQAIKSSTLYGNVTFQDLDGENIALTVDFSAYSQGLIAFVPTSNLTVGKKYKVKIGKNIGDTEGLTFQEDLDIIFTVERELFSDGTLVDDFETTGNWKTPQNSGSIGIDASSSFNVSASKNYEGAFSGELVYSYTDNTGLYKVSRETPVYVGGNAESEFGVWVKGELSNNVLIYQFIDSQNKTYEVEIDTLNFTGWKMKSIKLGDVASGNLKFSGVGIKHTPSGATSGKIYIDNAQYNFTTPVLSENNNLPDEYSLAQNYPNPFNPTTKIKFGLPESATVKLSIYNILGERVAELIGEKMNAGYHEVNFNATSFSTGIYIYRLETSKFTLAKKMLLLK